MQSKSTELIDVTNPVRASLRLSCSFQHYEIHGTHPMDRKQATQEVVSRVPVSTKEEMDAAVAAASVRAIRA